MPVIGLRGEEIAVVDTHFIAGFDFGQCCKVGYNTQRGDVAVERLQRNAASLCFTRQDIEITAHKADIGRCTLQFKSDGARRPIIDQLLPGEIRRAAAGVAWLSA